MERLEIDKLALLVHRSGEGIRAGSRAEASGEHEAMKKSTKRKAARRETSKKRSQKKLASSEKRSAKKATVRTAANKRGHTAETVSRRETRIDSDLRHAAIASAIRRLGK